MNENKSINTTELEQELATKQQRLEILEADEVEAAKRKDAAQEKLTGFGRTRLWLNEQRAELTEKRLALAGEWAERINTGARAIAPGAQALNEIISDENLLTVVHREIIEVQEPAARDALLVANLDLMSARADVAQLTADIHGLRVLQAAESVGSLEGHVQISGARSKQLAHVADIAIQDRESARQALEREREAQRSLREQSTGSIRWVNPS